MKVASVAEKKLINLRQFCNINHQGKFIKREHHGPNVNEDFNDEFRKLFIKLFYECVLRQ